jgi:hypothetical protein
MKKYYPSVRTIHLYVGLFISPIVLIFSISALVLNHTDYINRTNPIKNLPDIKTSIDKIPYDTTDLQTAKGIIKKLRIKGEIDYVSQNDSQISFPVILPGLTQKIKINKQTNEVLITRKEEGSLRATNFLHTMPGPHNAKLRGNSLYMQNWKIVADLVVYMLLFLSASGIFLWYFLKSERKLGWVAIILGAITFIGLLLFLLR